MIDSVQALLMLREAEDATKAYINHCTTCPNCKVEGLQVISLCGVGQECQDEYASASAAARPYVLNWKHGWDLYTRKNHLLLDICMQRGIPLIAWGDQPCHYDGSNRSQIVGSAYLYERGKTWSRKSLGQQ